MSAALSHSKPGPPNDSETRLAREATQALSRLVRHNTALRIDARGEGEGERATCVLPAAAVRLLFDILEQMAVGNTVTVTPVRAELTTQEAADILNVSRPFLVSLLEEGKLPFRKVGTHRRILYNDLVAYKRQEDEARRSVLRELAKQAQELGQGY
jgi:excisionase family DNA binding protein